MAIFTSANGYFEVTSVSFSPNVIAPNETISYSITIKNVSGKSISKMYALMSLHFDDVDGEHRSSNSVYMYGGPSFSMASISFANNASYTFTGTFKFSSFYTPATDVRLIPHFLGSNIGYSGVYANSLFGLMISFTTNATFPNGGNSDIITDVRGTNSEYLAAITGRYGFQITKYDIERSEGSTTNDEGEDILMELGLSIGSLARTSTISLRFYYAENGTATTSSNYIDLTSRMDEILSSTSAMTLLIDSISFSKESDWNCMIWIGDSYESISTARLLSKAFANVHLSGKKNGGVCFGSFSTSTDDVPLFENYYPMHQYESAAFHKGILNIQAGAVAALGNTSAGSYQDASVTFPTPFASGTTPIVVIGFRSESTAGSFGRCCVSVVSADNSGFTFRFFNGDGSARNPDYTYIAIGTPA